MTAFLIAAAALAAVAIVFIVPPLLSAGCSSRVSRAAVNAAVYRDQLHELDADLAAGTLSPEHYERAHSELEARLLHDVAEAAETGGRPPVLGRKLAIAAALAVPLMAAAVYVLVGAPQALDPDALAVRGAPEATAQQVAAMVEKLAARLADNPADAEGWAMLGRSYGVLGRYAESAAAYRNAVERAAPDAQLLTDYADALAMARGRNLRGEPEMLLGKALAIDPDNAKALALAGTAAFERHDYTQAAALWERLMKRVPPDSELGRALQGSIAEARALAKGGSGKR